MVVSELVDDLQAAGVVKRSPDPADARAKRVTSTPRGLDALLRGLEVLRDFEHELSHTVGATNLKQLQTTLLSILKHLEAGAKV